MCITGLHSLCSSPECVKVRNRASMTDLFLNSKPYNWINYSKLNDECHLIFWPTVMWAEINLFDVGLTSDFHVFMAEYWCLKVWKVRESSASQFFFTGRVSAWWVVAVASWWVVPNGLGIGVRAPTCFSWQSCAATSNRPAGKEEALLWHAAENRRVFRLLWLTTVDSPPRARYDSGCCSTSSFLRPPATIHHHCRWPAT